MREFGSRISAARAKCSTTRTCVTMALPNEEDYGPVMDSVEDVDALFKHLRGDDDG